MYQGGVISNILYDYYIKKLKSDAAKGEDLLKTQADIDKCENKINNDKNISPEKKELIIESINEHRKDNSEKCFKLGLEYFMKEPRELDAALKHFTSSIEQDPDKAEFFFIAVWYML